MERGLSISVPCPPIFHNKKYKTKLENFNVSLNGSKHRISIMYSVPPHVFKGFLKSTKNTNVIRVNLYLFVPDVQV